MKENSLYKITRDRRLRTRPY